MMILCDGNRQLPSGRQSDESYWSGDGGDSSDPIRSMGAFPFVLRSPDARTLAAARISAPQLRYSSASIVGMAVRPVRAGIT